MTGLTRAGIRVGTSIGGAQLGSVEAPYGSAVTRSIAFTATTNVVYVQLYSSANLDCVAKFDDIVLEDTGSYFVTGSPITLTKSGRIMQALGGTYAAAGTAVAMRVGRRVSIDPGVYIQNRTAAGLYVGRRISPAAGSYALLGSNPDVSYLHGIYLRVKGAYGIQGSDARLVVGRKLAIGSTVYAVTGSATSWVYARAIKASPGVYAAAGASVALKVGYRAIITPGAYVVTGTDLNLVNRRLLVTPGVYQLQPTDARLLRGRRIVATPGVYTVTGSNTTLLYGRRMQLSPATYALAGTDPRVLAGRLVRPAAGVYTVIPTNPRVLRGYTVHAVPGAYALSGAVTNLVLTRRMLLKSGSYSINPTSALLTATWRKRGPRAIAVGVYGRRYANVSRQSRSIPVGRQDRRVWVRRAERRYTAVEPRDKEIEGGSMLQWPEKDPNEVLDYELDWAKPDDPRLEEGETLLTSAWSVVEGDVVIDGVQTTFTPQGLSTVWLSGGTDGTKCILLNRVTTSSGRTYDKSVVLRVRSH